TKAIPAGMFADADLGDQLTLTATLADGRALPSWLSFANGVFSGMPDDAAVGITHLKVIATDTVGATAQTDFYILVQPVNDAPRVITPFETFRADYTTALSIQLPKAFYDPDDASLTLSITMANGDPAPSWLTLDAQGRISGIPSNGGFLSSTDEFKTLDLMVTARDHAGATASTPLNIDVFAELGQTVFGTGGNDTLFGSAGSDLIFPGLGDDTIYTGRRTDKIFFNAGDGHDLISRFNPSGNGQTSQQNDVRSVIVLGQGITPDDLVFTRDGSTIESPETYRTNLNIGFRNSTDQIRVTQQFDKLSEGYSTVSEIRFDNGIVWTEADIVARFLAATDGNDTLAGDGYANVISGGAGRDVLIGLDGNDTLNGGAGNDDLYGTTGDDTYIFERGSGADRILEDSTPGPFGIFTSDMLRFGAGISLSDLTVYRDERNAGSFGAPKEASSLLIKIKDTNDSVLIYNQYTFSGSTSGGVDKFAFADGSVLTLSQFDDIMFPDKTLAGTAAGENILGTSNNETLQGLQGNDTLQGNTGNDTYVWNVGDGNDSISEYTINSFDVLQFGACIEADEVVISRPSPSEINGTSANYLYLTYAPTGERITLPFQFDVDTAPSTPVL
ncbi:MAG: calcium-binding protein, partial [Hyphomicrobium sp.]